MKSFNKILYIASICLFFLTLGLTLIPSHLILLKKDDLKIILVDVSLSHKDFDLDPASSMSSIGKTLEEGTLVIRGFFADNAVYIDDEPIRFSSTEKNIFEDFKDTKRNVLGRLDLEATNYEKVVESVLRDYSDDYKCDILLITDGKQNQEDVIKINNRLKEKKARVQFFDTNYEEMDMSIDQCDLPKVVSAGNEVIGTIRIKSNFENKGTIINISVNDQNVKSIQSDIGKGVQQLSISVPLPDALHNKIEIELICDDVLKKNNKIFRYVKKGSSGRVLLVSNRKLDLPDAIKQSFDVIVPLSFSEVSAKVAQYESIWLDDVSWLEIAEKEKIETIEKYVSNGGKLFVSGGSHSFAFGSYNGTLLEKLLPVKTNPNGLLSLIVCIDASGSMEQQVHGKRKIDISVSALLELINGLQSMDEVGLIFCQSSRTPKEFIPLMAKEKFEMDLREKYHQIPLPSGGTFLKPGVQAAYDLLAKSNKELRVVIFITDGDSQEKDYQELFKQFKDSDPEMIFLVIGAGLNERSLLIEEGKLVFGKEWEPIRVEEKGWFNLKESFKEAFKKISAGFSAQGEFTTLLMHANPDFRFLKTHESSFNGVYLKTNLKNEATGLVEINEENPLLAVWTYGQGKVLSLQTGLFSNWSQEYFAGSQGGEVINSIFNWMTQSSLMSNELSYEYKPEGILFTFYSEDKNLSSEAILQLKIHDQELSLHRVDSSLWQARMGFSSVPKLWHSLSSIRYQVFKKIESGHIEVDNGEMAGILPSEYLSLESPKLFWSILGLQGANLKVFENWDAKNFEGAKKEEDITNYLAFVSLLFFLCMLFFRGRIFT